MASRVAAPQSCSLVCAVSQHATLQLCSPRSSLPLPLGLLMSLIFFVSSFYLYSSFRYTQSSLGCLLKKSLEIKKLKIHQVFPLWSLICLFTAPGARLIFCLAFKLDIPHLDSLSYRNLLWQKMRRWDKIFRALGLRSLAVHQSIR